MLMLNDSNPDCQRLGSEANSNSDGKKLVNAEAYLQ